MIFTYSGKFWDVPQGFAFPHGLKQNTGWKLWLNGMPGYRKVCENTGEEIAQPIRPFRTFIPGRLPKKVADTFKLHWRPLFQMMEEGLEDIPQNPSAESIDALCEQARTHLKTRLAIFSRMQDYIDTTGQSRHGQTMLNEA